MKIIMFGLLVAAISLYGMLYVSGYYIILLVATLFSTATTLIRPAVNTLISKTAGHEQGYAAGMNNSYMSLGNMIGPALAGTLFDWHMSLPFTFGAIILVGCFFLLLFGQRKLLHCSRQHDKRKQRDGSSVTKSYRRTVPSFFIPT